MTHNIRKKDIKLDEKIMKAKKVIKEITSKFDSNKVFIAWTGGKDSTVLLHLIRSVFQGDIPFPVMFNDSTLEFQEIYDFIKKISTEWNIDLLVVPHNQKQLDTFHKLSDIQKKQELSRLMKVKAIEDFIKKNAIDAFVVGIRWDEHPARSKESYFSQRKGHVRIHPILDFTEKDIWDYIKKYNVPYVNLYDKGYRSLGEKPFTNKVAQGEGERSGREYDKEQTMEKLRNMGYW
jgi:phosphoadenosine phosphosulfate reductase